MAVTLSGHPIHRQVGDILPISAWTQRGTVPFQGTLTGGHCPCDVISSPETNLSSVLGWHREHGLRGRTPGGLLQVLPPYSMLLEDTWLQAGELLQAGDTLRWLSAS